MRSLLRRAARQLRPLPPEALAKLDHYYDIEIAYALNTIEG